MLPYSRVLGMVCLFGVCLFQVNGLYGQASSALSLIEAYALLEARYPDLRNAGLIEEIHTREQAQLDRTQWPGLYFKTEGRLQSESPHLDVAEGVMLPFEIDLPLYSVRAYVEAQYQLFDGGLTRAQKRLKEARLRAERQDLAVDRYALRDRVNRLFLNITLLREQVRLFALSLDDLQARKERVEAGVDNGVILESELSQLEVRWLELKAQQDNLRYKISGLIQTLVQLVGRELSETVELQFPGLAEPGVIPELQRPEQRLFQQQRQALLAQTALVDASRRPRLSAFAQAGVGYPNPLNFLDRDASQFGVVGLQFNWQITDWRKSATDKELLRLRAQKIQHAEETFVFNMKSKEASYLAEVDRLQMLIENDRQVARLQAEVLAQKAAQFDEGVITSSDYITQVNAELKARQNLVIHQTELLQNQLLFWNERGGF